MFNVYILYSDPCFSPNQICLKKCRGPLIQRAVSPSVYAFMRRLAAFVVIGRSRQSRSLNDPAHLWGSRKPVLAMFRPSCYQNKRFCWFILSKSIQHIGNDHTPWSELKPGIPISDDQRTFPRHGDHDLRSMWLVLVGPNHVNVAFGLYKYIYPMVI